MIDINWNNIRCVDSSQQNGFEEFICQLARKQKIDNAEKFIRIGKPDGGVEGYWICKDGSEICWQAKFFTSAISNSQWNQINSSVKTVLNTHKNLKKYIICFPHDLSDGRNNQKGKKIKSEFDKWNECLEKWTSESRKKGMNVEFCYWGSSELIKKLQNTEYSSFINFWFDTSFLSDSFIDNFNSRMIKNLGPKYFKDIDIKVPFYSVQHWIDRDEEFYNELNTIYLEVNSYINKLIDDNNRIYFSYVEELRKIWSMVHKEFSKNITMDSLNSLKNLSIKLEEISEEIRRKWFSDDGSNCSFFNKNEDLLSNLEILNVFLNGNPVNLYEQPYLLVHGGWGMGKSHALASIVEQRNEKNLKSLLFLGQQFTSDKSPEQQILDILGVKCSFLDILEGLNCIGEQKNQRVLIIIDAINEGNGKEIWNNHLANLINLISEYEYLGVILSVRSTYLELFDEQIKIVNDKLTLCKIEGFEINQNEAIKSFFEYYKLNIPTIPLLSQEFSNPLFLSIFSQTYKNASIDSTVLSNISLMEIFKGFTDKINNVLAKKNNYENMGNAVDFFIQKFAEITLKERRGYLIQEEIRKLNKTIKDEFCITSNFIGELLSENILVKDMRYNSKEEIYLLSYERLLDYAQSIYILTKYKDETLRLFLSDKENLYIFDDRYKGLLEMLIIYFSDVDNQELLEYIPGSFKDSVFEIYLSSFQWRKSYPNRTILNDWIKMQITEFKKRSLFFENIFYVVAKENCPFNAEYLFDLLFPLSMAERDSFWSIAICSYSKMFYDEVTSVLRIFNYVKNYEIYLSDDILFLYSMALVWLFSLPNRKIRDTATKCLVKFLTNHTNILFGILRKFEGINDPYIYERIFAVCYGVLTRSNSIENGKELGEYIYKTIFNQGEVYPNILLRDYAKQSIQILLQRNFELDIDKKLISPPYRSEWGEKFPTNEEIDNFHNITFAEKHIHRSMITEYGRGMCSYGDFGRYRFGTSVSNWKDVDENDLSNLAVKWIFEKYGWTSEKFEDFDSSIGSGRSRYEKIEERIGKKYQWIALYEIMARLADNASYYPNSFYNKIGKYKGPFESTIRNIDPTLGLNVINEQNVDLYDITFSSEENNNKWLHCISDIPQIKELIFDKTNNHLCLFKHFKKIDSETGNFISDSQDKQIWLWIQSFLVKKTDVKILFDKLKDKNFEGRWLPEGAELSQIYSREFFYSDAYKYNMTEVGYSEEAEIENVKDIVVLPTIVEYRLESSSDYSLEESINLLKPCKFFVEKMKLHTKHNESYFYNKNDGLVFFDDGESPKRENAMLGNKNLILDFLRNSDYTIIWTLLGEKQITNIYDFKAERYLPSYSQIAYLDNNGEIIQSTRKIFPR